MKLLNFIKDGENMVFGYRYIDVEENGRVAGSKMVPTAKSIDTEGMTMPEMPTDAIYELYYDMGQKALYWKKVGEFAEQPLTFEERTDAALTLLMMKEA